MRSREKKIYDELNSHYPENISFLRADDPFVFLVTVMLSASSTDKRAQAASDRLFSIYKDRYAIALAEEDSVEEIIHDVGLARSKAKNIIKMAKMIVESGHIPEDMKGLCSLPGVGEKTASCYISTILGKPAVIADIHFVRVANRLDLIDTQDRNKAASEIRNSFPENMWTRLSMTINLHGRVICKPKPKCTECFLARLCSYKT